MPSFTPDADRLGPAQWLAVGVCVLLNVVDGFDIFVMSTAAAHIKTSLGLSTPDLGLILSASLAGMMIGALFLAPLADRWGRRPMIMLCLALDTLGMVGAAFAAGRGQMIAFRLVTGLGVGAIMPVINSTCAELSGGFRRNLIITAQATGYPLGGLIAAIAGAAWLDGHDWRSLLLLAAVPAALAMAGVVFLLPESVPFLLAKRPPGALERINRTLARFGKPLLAALPPPPPATERTGLHRLFAGDERRGLVLFALATFLTQFSFYFFVSWLPTVIAPHLGDAAALRGAGSVMLNLGGVLGDILFGSLCLWLAARGLTLGAMLAAFAAIALLAVNIGQPLVTVTLALAIGAALFAAMAGIYATAPAVFAPLSRAAGTGFAFSLGRFGGALSPWLGALLLAGPSPGLAASLLLMALPLPAAAFLIRRLARSAVHA